MSELKVIDLGNIRESIEKHKPVYYEYYAKSEADKEIRRLRRALWLARADRAISEAYNCHLADAANLWIRNARKMSAKAEEYK